MSNDVPTFNELRAAKTQRQHYSGIWLPEPQMIESLATPAARAAFLLYEFFDKDDPEVAEAIGKTQAACRQLVSRARAQFKDDCPRYVLR